MLEKIAITITTRKYFFILKQSKLTFMKKDTVIKVSFVLSLLLTSAGAMLKILHEPKSEPFLILGIIASIIFIVLAIYEVRTSTRIDRTEKTMWTIAFIFMCGLTGLIYFIMGRKRIISKPVKV